MRNIINGGFLSGYRTYLISASGVISAIIAYLVGDTDIFIMLQSIFTAAHWWAAPQEWAACWLFPVNPDWS